MELQQLDSEHRQIITNISADIARAAAAVTKTKPSLLSLKTTIDDMARDAAEILETLESQQNFIKDAIKSVDEGRFADAESALDELISSID